MYVIMKQAESTRVVFILKKLTRRSPSRHECFRERTRADEGRWESTVDDRELKQLSTFIAVLNPPHDQIFSYKDKFYSGFSNRIENIDVKFSNENSSVNSFKLITPTTIHL